MGSGRKECVYMPSPLNEKESVLQLFFASSIFTSPTDIISQTAERNGTCDINKENPTAVEILP